MNSDFLSTSQLFYSDPSVNACHRPALPCHPYTGSQGIVPTQSVRQTFIHRPFEDRPFPVQLPVLPDPLAPGTLLSSKPVKLEDPGDCTQYPDVHSTDLKEYKDTGVADSSSPPPRLSGSPTMSSDDNDNSYHRSHSDNDYDCYRQQQRSKRRCRTEVLKNECDKDDDDCLDNYYSQSSADDYNRNKCKSLEEQ